MNQKSLNYATFEIVKINMDVNNGGVATTRIEAINITQVENFGASGGRNIGIAGQKLNSTGMDRGKTLSTTMKGFTGMDNNWWRESRHNSNAQRNGKGHRDGWQK